MRSSISLRSRLSLAALLVALTSVAAALGAFYVSSRVLRDSLDREIVDVAKQLERPSPSGSSSPASLDPTSVPGKYQVLLTTSSGSTVYSSASTVTLEGLDPGWYSKDGYRIHVSRRSLGGNVAVAVSTSDVDHALQVALLALLCASGGLVVAVCLTFVWVHRRGVRPLAEIAHVANDVAAGATTARVHEEGLPQEAALLASAVNNLLVAQERALSLEAATAAEQRRFLLDASHELRNPLTAILGWSDLLRRGAVPADRMAPALDRIANEASRMQRLCEQLLTVARSETIASSNHPGDLSRALRQAASDHSAADPTRPVVLLAPDELVVALDEDSCVQLCANLFSNLRAHTPAGTTATIELAHREDRAVLSYHDDGPGVLAPERVFDRFYQADPSRATKGTGLGLAVLKALVEAHGGKVSASSPASGGFSLALEVPLQPVSPDSTAV